MLKQVLRFKNHLKSYDPPASARSGPRQSQPEASASFREKFLTEKCLACVGAIFNVAFWVGGMPFQWNGHELEKRIRTPRNKWMKSFWVVSATLFCGFTLYASLKYVWTLSTTSMTFVESFNVGIPFFALSVVCLLLVNTAWKEQEVVAVLNDFFQFVESQKRKVLSPYFKQSSRLTA